MYNRIKECYYWKNMRADIERYTQNCKLCQTNKPLRKINRTATAFCAIIIATGNGQYIERIDKSPGIFFDPVGTLRIINDQFHIVIPVDVHPIQHHLENIHEVFKIIRFQCHESADIDYTQCENMLQPLEALYNDILRDFNAISHIILNGMSKRSAWFSGIGTVFKHIFGTLDENDAENYNKAIHALFNNENKLAESTKKHILVSKSAISSVNKSLEELNDNQIKLNSVIELLSSTVKNASEMLNVLSFQTKLSNVLNTLLSNLLTMSFKVEDLLNSILFVITNTLHPSVLSPTQMYNDIISNLRIMPKYKDFPISLELSNIHTLIDISDLVCYYLDNKLIFIIKLPLVSLLKYNMYKNLPLPTPHAQDRTNSFAMIIPSEKFVALSKDKTSYVYLQELNNYKNIPTNTYLCDVVDVATISNNIPCEIEIMTKALISIPDNCPFRLISGDLDIWHKLYNNKWIFVQTKPTKLSVECSNNLTEYTLSGTGLLTIPPDCVAFHKNLKLEIKLYPSISVPGIYSDFNIINDSCCKLSNLNKFSFNLTSSINVKTMNLENLKSYNTDSDQIVKRLDTLESPNLYNVSFSIISLISVILCISIITYIICKRGKSFRDHFNFNKENTENHHHTDQPQLRIE
ncbi:unnamed protein product [Parnassius mnemosyne]|uniref:Integrase zinc-binding domain-containing protein n=1 Tax=Parnassius mnemosyne TaxID=213953 RepID=A0AAV1LNR2_9NEOP